MEALYWLHQLFQGFRRTYLWCCSRKVTRLEVLRRRIGTKLWVLLYLSYSVSFSAPHGLMDHSFEDDRHRRYPVSSRKAILLFFPNGIDLGKCHSADTNYRTLPFSFTSRTGLVATRKTIDNGTMRECECNNMSDDICMKILVGNCTDKLRSMSSFNIWRRKCLNSRLVPAALTPSIVQFSGSYCRCHCRAFTSRFCTG